MISNPSPTNQQENALTCAERYGSSIGGAEQAKIDAGELAIDYAVQLRVARRGFAEKRRGHDAFFNALGGRLKYATALSIKACLLLIPGSLAKSTIASAFLFRCAHARSALTPASTTQGSFFASCGPRLHGEVLPALGYLSEVGLGDSLEEQGGFC